MFYDHDISLATLNDLWRVGEGKPSTVCVEPVTRNSAGGNMRVAVANVASVHSFVRQGTKSLASVKAFYNRCYLT
jgi:hypothetical protein